MNLKYKDAALSIQDYLAEESNSPVKREFINGGCVYYGWNKHQS